MNILDLPLRELRIIHRALRREIYDYPELEGVCKLSAQIKAKMEENPLYQKGLALLAVAEKESGLDSGHARAEDYYFAIVHQEIFNTCSGILKTTGRKYYELILCFKWNWWMNGEAYIHQMDGEIVRNFTDFIPKDLQISFRQDGPGGYSSSDAIYLRNGLITSGLEEKPELIQFYNERVEAYRKQQSGTENASQPSP